MAVLVYTDEVKNPVLEASAHFARPARTWSRFPQGAMLFDPQSGLLRAAGPDYSSTGFEASAQRNLPGNNLIRASYTSGDAVVMPALPQADFSQLIAAAHTRAVCRPTRCRSPARWMARARAGRPATAGNPTIPSRKLRPSPWTRWRPI